MMADDPWAVFPIVGTASSTAATPPAATTAPPTDWWTQFPVSPNQIPTTVGTKAVSAAPSLTGQALSALGDWLGGPGFTTLTRGLGGLADTIRDPGNAIVSPFATLISPEAEKRYQADQSQGYGVGGTRGRGFLPGIPTPGDQLASTAFATIGLPEYTAQSAPERILMSGIEGGISNAPLGLLAGPEVGVSRALPATVGTVSGLTGQTVREILPPGPNTDRIATAASLAPALLAGTGEATRVNQPRIPTAQELEDAGAAGFRATRASPVEFSRDPLVSGVPDAKLDAYQNGFDPKLTPQTDSLIDDRITGASGSMNFNEAHSLRKALNTIIDNNRTTLPGTGNPNEVALASRLKTQLDGYLSSLGQDPANITAGTVDDAAAAAKTFQDALGNYAAAKRSDKISGALRQQGTGGSIMGSVQNATEAAYSGWNYDNILRQRTRGFMENDRKMASYTPDEAAALDAVRQGSFARNRLRELANIFGGGGGAGFGLTSLLGGSAGFGALGPWGMALAPIPPIAGTIMKAGQNALARGSINAADTLVRQRSPLYQDAQTQAALQNLQPRDMAVIQAVLPGLLAPPPQTQPTGPGLLYP